MINIDTTTVAVETSAELKSILDGNNSITLVYFAQDICNCIKFPILH